MHMSEMNRQEQYYDPDSINPNKYYEIKKTFSESDYNQNIQETNNPHRNTTIPQQTIEYSVKKDDNFHSYTNNYNSKELSSAVMPQNLQLKESLEEKKKMNSKLEQKLQNLETQMRRLQNRQAEFEKKELEKYESHSKQPTREQLPLTSYIMPQKSKIYPNRNQEVINKKINTNNNNNKYEIASKMINIAIQNEKKHRNQIEGIDKKKIIESYLKNTNHYKSLNQPVDEGNQIQENPRIVIKNPDQVSYQSSEYLRDVPQMQKKIPPSEFKHISNMPKGIQFDRKQIQKNPAQLEMERIRSKNYSQKRKPFKQIDKKTIFYGMKLNQNAPKIIPFEDKIPQHQIGNPPREIQFSSSNKLQYLKSKEASTQHIANREDVINNYNSNKFKHYTEKNYTNAYDDEFQRNNQETLIKRKQPQVRIIERQRLKQIQQRDKWRENEQKVRLQREEFHKRSKSLVPKNQQQDPILRERQRLYQRQIQKQRQFLREKQMIIQRQKKLEQQRLRELRRIQEKQKQRQKQWQYQKKIEQERKELQLQRQLLKLKEQSINNYLQKEKYRILLEFESQKRNSFQNSQIFFQNSKNFVQRLAIQPQKLQPQKIIVTQSPIQKIQKTQEINENHVHQKPITQQQKQQQHQKPQQYLLQSPSKIHNQQTKQLELPSINNANNLNSTNQNKINPQNNSTTYDNKKIINTNHIHNNNNNNSKQKQSKKKQHNLKTEQQQQQSNISQKSIQHKLKEPIKKDMKILQDLNNTNSKDLSQQHKNYNSKNFDQSESYAIAPFEEANNNKSFESVTIDNPNITDIEFSLARNNDQLNRLYTIFPKIPERINPLISDTELEQLARQTFEAFNIPVKSNEILNLKRFKNCVYFNIDHHHILWHFDGKLYLGGWIQTNQETQGLKSGKGIQYNPKKYIYEGEFKKGRRNGFGIMCSVNGDNYVGQWSQGLRHGKGKMQEVSGIVYDGEWKLGKKQGYGKLIFSTGQVYEGMFNNGLKHGFGKETYKNGDSYKGQYSQGLFSGEGIYRWGNGAIYHGNFVNGKRHGKGKWKSLENGPGDSYDGDYCNDKKQGFGKYTWENKSVYEGQFLSDLKHGEGVLKYYQSNKAIRGIWQLDQLRKQIKIFTINQLESTENNKLQKSQQQNSVSRLYRQKSSKATKDLSLPRHLTNIRTSKN